MTKKTSKLVISESKLKEHKFDEKFTRVDGKKLTKKQKEKLFKKVTDEEKEEGYNPRECILKNGIRNYDERMRKRKEGIFS
jgi:ribonuclease HII